MKSKKLALVLTGVIAVTLTACGTPSTESTAGSSAGTSAESSTGASSGDSSKETTGKSTGAEEEGKSEISADNPLAGKKIGCTIVYKGDEWCSALASCLEDVADKYGCEIVVEDGDLNDETQSKQVENMVAAGVDMMFVDPATPDGVTEAMNKAVDAGIPIFIYDGYWNEDKAVTTVTWNQPLTGELMADYVIDYVDKNLNGKAKVVVLTLKSSTHCVEREEAFKEAVAGHGGIEVINTQDCEGNREKGANAITNIVEPFDIVVSVVDNGAWGAVSALQARGLTDVKVFSMGAYGSEPFEALKNEDPNYEACVVVPPQEIADTIYQAASDYFEGKEVEKTTNIELAVADSSNVTDFWTFQ